MLLAMEAKLGALFINAKLHQKCLKMFPTSPSDRTPRSAASKVQHVEGTRKLPPPLDMVGKKFIQEATRVFLYLARVVDLMMLTPLSALGSEQAALMKRTMQKCLQVLDYALSQEDAIVTY